MSENLSPDGYRLDTLDDYIFDRVNAMNPDLLAEWITEFDRDRATAGLPPLTPPIADPDGGRRGD